MRGPERRLESWIFQNVQVADGLEDARSAEPFLEACKDMRDKTMTIGRFDGNSGMNLWLRWYVDYPSMFSVRLKPLAMLKVDRRRAWLLRRASAPPGLRFPPRASPRCRGRKHA